MPEHVVIIGPATRPAGPIAGPAEPEHQDAPDDTGSQPEARPASGKAKKSVLVPALARFGGRLVGLGARGLWACAKGCLRVAGHYPRHSLAAGVSVVILGAISYAQLRPGAGTRAPVTTEIPSASATKVAGDRKNAPAAKPSGVTPSPGPTVSTTAGESGSPNPPGATRAGTHTTSSPGKLAAAAATKVDAVQPAPVASAPAPTQDHEPSPGKTASAADPAPFSKPDGAPTPAATREAATPTLVATIPTDAAPVPSSAAGKGDKTDEDAVKPAPTLDAPAPALTPALTPATNPPGEMPPIVAPTAGEPPRAATALEADGVQNKSVPTTAPTPSSQVPDHKAADTGSGSGNSDGKAQEAAANHERDEHQKPDPASKADAAQQPAPSTNETESTKIKPNHSEPPQSGLTKVEAPKAGTEEPAPKPPSAPLPPPVIDLPIPGNGRADVVNPAAESAPPRLDASGPGEQNPGSQSAMPVSAPATPTAPREPRVPAAESQSPPADTQVRVPEPTAVEKESPGAELESKEPPPRKTSTNSRDSGVKNHTLEDLTKAGWVAVPNSGKVLIDAAVADDGPRGGADPSRSVDPAAARDVRAHAAKDVSFELQSPRSRANQDPAPDGHGPKTGLGSAPPTRSLAASGRVESVPHVVEPEENFWTISRLYYSSGRYHRALWKANADKYPEIGKLTVNDVIMIPPVEDLDPAYIDPPRTRAPATLGGAARRSRGKTQADAADLADSAVSSAAGEPVSTTRTNRGSAGGVPVRRSSRTDPDLDLPPPEAVAQRDRAADRTERRSDLALGEEDAKSGEPEIRSAARPRATGSSSLSRPAYKVRPYDTLRSIARDMLGDSHRTSEILELNRELIDDPSHLIVGQVLELPEDARTSVRRSSSR